jgi:pantoate--beta-alanine ligase
LNTRIIKTVDEWKALRITFRSQDKKIGFVPTMGALHDGHLSLIKKSIEHNDITVVSIFVNKTQFNDTKDFENYPKSLQKDLEVLQENNVEYLYLPEYEDIYPDNYQFRVVENQFSNILCGSSRKGHFEGVLTVVMKLLNIIAPDKAYFGEKDYQQYKLIEMMCRAFFMDVEIIPCQTTREPDGLAMSSRNLLLTKDERNIARWFPAMLKSDLSPSEISSELEKLGFKVDYITDLEGRRFGAVYLGNVRLIDNVEL